MKRKRETQSFINVKRKHLHEIAFTPVQVKYENEA